VTAVVAVAAFTAGSTAGSVAESTGRESENTDTGSSKPFS
jgi:hypothetical protein